MRIKTDFPHPIRLIEHSWIELVDRGEIVRFDPTVQELADLPLGWYAWRNAVGEPWQRRER
jgi:hypothetical protein